MRSCPTCNKSEPEIVFVPRRLPCKACIQEAASNKAKAKRSANKKPKRNAKKREYDVDGNLIRRECGACKTMLTINAFNKNPGHADGFNNVCRECTKLRWRETATDKRVAYLLHRLKSKAKQIGVPFNLDLCDIVVPDVCPVLNIPLSFGKETEDTGWRDNSPSVDRVIPSLGYVKGNVIVISYRANRIKNDATIDELEKVATFFKTLSR